MGKTIRDEGERLKVRSFRTTDAEWDRLAELALAAGVTTSDFVRRASLGCRLTRAPGPKRADPALVTELHRVALALDRVGNNVNQIAAATHAGKPLPGLSAAAAEELRKERAQVRAALARLVEQCDAD